MPQPQKIYLVPQDTKELAERSIALYEAMITMNNGQTIGPVSTNIQTRNIEVGSLTIERFGQREVVQFLGYDGHKEKPYFDPKRPSIEELEKIAEQNGFKVEKVLARNPYGPR